MVCEKCERKLKKLACPEVYSKLSGKPRREINENKLLTARKLRETPYTSRCKICKQKCHQPNAKYCQKCAYKKGLCALCGTMIMDTKEYRQSTT
ncbi:cysteine-rich PDZ-binding protein-like [Zophobas morio]|uniref:cysteine-rich PDZ-binding protein-like n=1 Tax=Zophobas morio TaxID=2755281 RepID=UPI0030835C08